MAVVNKNINQIIEIQSHLYADLRCINFVNYRVSESTEMRASSCLLRTILWGYLKKILKTTSIYCCHLTTAQAPM